MMVLGFWCFWQCSIIDFNTAGTAIVTALPHFPYARNLTFETKQEFFQNGRPRSVSNFSVQSFGFAAVATAILWSRMPVFLSIMKRPRK